MDNRMRFLRTMRFESVDHPPLLVPGPWPATRRRWEWEGLPAGIPLEDYFGLEPFRLESVGIQTLFYPPVEPQILEQTDEFVIKIDRRGVKVKNFKNESSMPEFLEYPIRGPESLPWLNERLDPETPGRVNPDWQAKTEAQRNRGSLIFCNGGMYFAFLNEHVGTERLMTMYHDAPDFIHAVNDLVCKACEKALTTCLPRFPLDLLGYHEDMAYKNGSMISPAMFREFMTPYYRRIMAIAAPHGIDLHLMDSDGDIRQLIPLWLECGINLFSPLEVAAGMDVVKLRVEYGKQIGMIGGFDKRILAFDVQAIRTELNRLRPVIEGGGYIPNCDHGVPPDVPLANVCCFIDTLKSMYGMNQQR